MTNGAPLEVVIIRVDQRSGTVELEIPTSATIEYGASQQKPSSEPATPTLHVDPVREFANDEPKSRFLPARQPACARDCVCGSF
jgi:hypothetical protein